MDMLNNLIVGLISQCIHISKYHIVYLKHNNNFVHQLHFSKASGEAKTGNKTKILFLLLTTKNFDLYKNNLKETLKIYMDSCSLKILTLHGKNRQVRTFCI